MRVGTGFFDLAAFQAAETELGSQLLYTVQFTGRQSQRDMNGSAFGLLASEEAGLPIVADRLNLSITVPLGFGNANARTAEGRDEIASNLEGVASGEYDDAYRRVARRLIEGGYPDAIIRLGHEFNGAWAPWSSRDNEAAYIAAYRHVHDVLTSESDQFRFDWTSMRNSWLDYGPDAYPGDDYVDIIGLDVYWRANNADSVWDSGVWEQDFVSVMRNHQNFAAERDKPVSYPEWGVGGADNPMFIEAMHGWFAEMPEDGPGRLEYQAYFNSGDEFALDNYPNAEDAYLRLFGSENP